MLQPGVLAAGKKYSTTGPSRRAPESEYSKASPASQAGALKSGARSPGLSVARACGEQAEARARAASTMLRLNVVRAGPPRDCLQSKPPRVPPRAARAG